jgi:hypothetical protein
MEQFLAFYGTQSFSNIHKKYTPIQRKLEKDVTPQKVSTQPTGGYTTKTYIQDSTKTTYCYR